MGGKSTEDKGQFTRALMALIASKHTLALGILAVLVVAGYLSLHFALAFHENHSGLINISERQRIAVQQADILADNIVKSAKGTLKHQKLLEELTSLTGVIESTHNRFTTNTNTEDQFSGNYSKAVHAIYFEKPFSLDKQMREYIAALRSFAKKLADGVSPAVPYKTIVATIHGGRLVESLGKVVDIYQREEKKRAKELKLLSTIIFAFILIGLPLEGYFIFRPLWRHIYAETNKLNTENGELEKIAHDRTLELAQVNRFMESEIAKHKRTEQKLLRVNRALLVTEACGRAIRHADDETKFLNEICKLIVETGGYRMAWVGYATHDEKKTVRHVAHAGFDAEYLEAINTAWGGAEQSPASISIRDNSVVVIKDIFNDQNFTSWREEATRHGYASVAIFPIVIDTAPIGVLLAYSSEPDAFDEDEIGLLSGLTEEAGLGITTVRAYTDRERAVEALLENETRMKTIVDTVTDGILITEFDGRIIYANAAADRIFESSVKDHLWKDLMLKLMVDDKDALELQMILNNDKTVYGFEFGAHRQDGTGVTFSMNSAPIKDFSGSVVGMVSTVRNVTRKKETEDRLRKFSLAVEQSAAGVIITDLNGVIEYINEKFCKLTGYCRDEVIGQNPRILKSGKTADEKYQELWKAISSGREWVGEFCNKKKNGEVYWEYIAISPIRNSEGVATHFLAIMEDITARKNSEKQAMLNQQQLIHADKMKTLGTLVAGVAHEINNPNSFIMLNTPLLKDIWGNIASVLEEYQKERGDLRIGVLSFNEMRETVVKLLDGINAGSERIEKIVAKLKDFSQKDLKSNKYPFNINRAIESAIVLTGSMIKESTDNFSVKLDDNLPNVMGDFVEIEQVFINLISNACQALADKEKSIFVTTSYDEKSAMVVVSVADEGVGILPENINKVADPFFTTKRNIGGTGLGLSVSYGIIKDHRGSWEFMSQNGAGTCVKVALPIAERSG